MLCSAIIRDSCGNYSVIVGLQRRIYILKTMTLRLGTRFLFTGMNMVNYLEILVKIFPGCSRLGSVTSSILRPQQCSTPLYLPTCPMSEFSPSISESSLPPSIFKPGVVIFDKDGTLVCFHTMWNTWCEELATR